MSLFLRKSQLFCSKFVFQLVILAVSVDLVCGFSLAPFLSAARSKGGDSVSSARYLETNCWALALNGLTVLIDPVLEKPLTFGVPFIYTGTKRFINGPLELERYASSADVVLISQGFDDHAHGPSLEKLFDLNPDMPYVCPPSAVPILSACGIPASRISVIRPGESTLLKRRKDGEGLVEVYATTGALLGPPWQAKENGYILRPPTSTGKKGPSGKQTSFPSVYYEPHCMFDPQEITTQQLKADYVITPVATQELSVLPSFPLVEGGVKSLDLARLLNAKKILPMANGELIQTGLSAPLIRNKGSEIEFKEILKSSGLPIELIPVVPGVEVEIK